MQTNSIKGTYFSIFILHAAMIVGPTVLAGIFWFLVNQGESNGETAPTEDMKLIFQIIVLATLCMGYVINKLVIAKQMQEARKSESLEGKLTIYRGINILRTAILEGAALASLVFFFISWSQSFFYMALLILGFMLAIFPTQARIIKDLALNDNEEREFRKALNES